MEGRNELTVIPVERTEEVLQASFNQAFPIALLKRSDELLAISAALYVLENHTLHRDMPIEYKPHAFIGSGLSAIVTLRL